MSRGGGHSSRGEFVQRAWISEDLADDPSINLLETRAASKSVLALAEPGDCVKLHIDNRTVAAYIHCQGGRKVIFSRRKHFVSGSKPCPKTLLS